MILWIIIWIILFFALVLWHEFWHFIAAKKSWVKVLEFGIWIPPKICTIFEDKSWTKYTINALPLWGFVRLKWEDPNNTEEFNARDSFIKAKFHKKITILIAGVTMNFIIAWWIFTTIFTIWTKPILVLPENALSVSSESYLMPSMDFLERNNLLSWEIQKTPAIVQDVYEKWLGSQIWLKSWDIITFVNNKDINSRNLSKNLKNNIWQDTTITFKRGLETLEKNFKCPDDSCLLEISIQNTWSIETKLIKAPLTKAMWMAIKEIKVQTELTMSALWRLWNSLISFNWKKIKDSINKLSWPVWAIKFGWDLLKERWIIPYLWFAWIISLALALLNILPIPALDWWRLLGVIIQAIWKLKPEKYFFIENIINIVFFIILLWLWVYIILKDLVMARNVNIPFIW